MGIDYTLLILVVLLGTGLALAPLLARVRISPNVTLMITGFVGSELIVAAGMDTGIRWYQFHGLIFFVLLPILIFEGALVLDTRLLRENLVAILVLSTPLLAVTAAIITVVVHFGVDAPAGLPWILAMLTAALLATTDSAGLPRDMGDSPSLRRLRVLIEGESNFNDAVSIVLVSVLLMLALDGTQTTPRDAAVEFLVALFGGLACGFAFGWAGVLLLRHIKDFALTNTATLLLIYAAYITAETLLKVSGVMALLVVGILIGWHVRKRPDAEQNQILRRVWEYKAYLASAFTFLLMGITITGQMFVDHWLNMLVAIAAVAAARGLSILVGTSALSWLPGCSALRWRERPVLALGGLPGAVSVALALSLPLALESWYTVQSMVYGVVIFYFVLQTPLLLPLMKRVNGASARQAAGSQD